MERGWDPEVKKYFRKVLFSITYGLIWLMTMAWLGLYKGYSGIRGNPSVTNILFYAFMFLTLAVLLYYYYRTWRK